MRTTEVVQRRAVVVSHSSSYANQDISRVISGGAHTKPTVPYPGDSTAPHRNHSYPSTISTVGMRCPHWQKAWLHLLLYSHFRHSNRPYNPVGPRPNPRRPQLASFPWKPALIARFSVSSFFLTSPRKLDKTISALLPFTDATEKAQPKPQAESPGPSLTPYLRSHRGSYLHRRPIQEEPLIDHTKILNKEVLLAPHTTLLQFGQGLVYSWAVLSIRITP